MIKISTLYKKDPNDLSRVIDEVNPENAWALTEGVPTRKFDGTAMAIINGELYKRYDVKKGREVPYGAIPCQDPDPITGHWPHWVKCEPSDPSDKFAFEAFEIHEMAGPEDGTYELCGPKVQGNPEGFSGHVLVKHGSVGSTEPKDRSFEGIKTYLEGQDIEGIVFHHPDGRMCKIRKKDFGLKRKP